MTALCGFLRKTLMALSSEHGAHDDARHGHVQVGLAGQHLAVQLLGYLAGGNAHEGLVLGDDAQHFDVSLLEVWHHFLLYEIDEMRAYVVEDYADELDVPGHELHVGNDAVHGEVVAVPGDQ